MTTDAKYLQVGDKFRQGKSIQQVKSIDRVTDKAITFTTKRVYPDFYDGNFFVRKSLSTKVEIVK